MDPIFTISAFTENSPGVLHRITAMFTRRKINVESLTVSETERHGISRFTIVIRAEADLVDKLVKQIARVIEVIDVFASTNSELLYKEIAFIKVNAADAKARQEIDRLAREHGAITALVDGESIVLEKTGTEDDVKSLNLLLEPYGVVEFIRSGRIAIRKSI